jgi:hypothetical protein
MKAFVKLTDPIIKLFKWITPSFLIQPFVPLYVAWFFFMFRFYLMPWLLGYSVMGMLSFPLESELAGARRRQPGRFLRRLTRPRRCARPAPGSGQLSRRLRFYRARNNPGQASE